MFRTPSCGRRVAVVWASSLITAASLAACGEEASNSDGPAERPEYATTADAKAPPLDSTLRILRAGDGEALCDLYTVRYLYDLYLRTREPALQYCRREAKRERADAEGLEINVKPIEKEERSAVVSFDIADFPPLLVYLVSDGERWLVDDVGEGERDLTRRERPAVVSGITGEQLEGFLREVSRVEEVSCAQVIDQNLGEWECHTVVKSADGVEKPGDSVVTVAPDGSVSAYGQGAGSGVGGCCVALDRE